MPCCWTSDPVWQQVWFAHMLSFSKISVIFVCAMLASAMAGAGAWGFVAQRGSGQIAARPEALEPAQAGLVLGTARLLKGGRKNLYFSYRMQAAAALFASGKVKYLIVSGNQAGGGREAGGYDEPADMRDELVALGVPAARIYRDSAGFRTLDSVLRARSIFGQERVIVVSQRFHLQRALYLAQSHGMQFQGFEARDVPLRWGARIKLREIGARVKAVLDVLTDTAAQAGGKAIVLGVDPPS